MRQAELKALENVKVAIEGFKESGSAKLGLAAWVVIAETWLELDAEEVESTPLSDSLLTLVSNMRHSGFDASERPEVLTWAASQLAEALEEGLVSNVVALRNVVGLGEYGEVDDGYVCVDFFSNTVQWSESLIVLPSLRRSGPKVGRNDKCPCASGKKFKKCCLKVST